MNKDIFKSTVLDSYPSYTKKIILKQAVNEGLIINNKKRSPQMTLNFTDSIDVTADETLDDKLKHMLESENILAFTADCNYSVRFLASGIISQKGLMTSTLRGTGPNSFAAILVDGNPMVLDNRKDGSTLEVDPDAMVAFIGADPQFKTDLSWRNLIGQASGESYMMEWASHNPAAVIYQPNERSGGISVGID